MPSLPLRVALWLLLSATTAPFLVAAKIDLKREKPVPDNEPIPVSDFFRPALINQPSLNSAGTHVAAIVTDGSENHQLLVYALATQKGETFGIDGDYDLRNVHWLDDERILFQVSTRKLYSMGLMAANIHALSRPYPLLQYLTTRVISIPTSDGAHPFVWNRYDAINNVVPTNVSLSTVDATLKFGEIIDLYRVGTPEAVAKRIALVQEQNYRHIVKSFPTPPGDHTTDYFNDFEGQLDFAITQADGVFSLYRFVANHWEKCPVDLDSVTVVDHGDRHGQLVVLAPREAGKPRAVRYLDGATGELGETILQDPAYDFYSGGLNFGGFYRDPAKHQIIGASLSRSGPQIIWLTEEYLALQKILDGFFPGQVVRILGSDRAQKRFLVATSTDRQPAIYQWVDLEKRTASLLKRSAPWINPGRMQPMTPLRFKTRDGHRLEAYLTLPAGASKATPPPLVVLSHGGPWARDTWGFDGEVQFLASRGYAVLQPNYRGSNGYGWMFPESDNWDFLKMSDDVTDATKALIASGLIDKTRIALMGASFGGYLAVSGVVREPDLYRCAVTIAGVFDWAQQIRSKKYDQNDSPVYSYMLHRLGDPEKEPALFEAISPGRHADQIKVPVFIAGGSGDQTVEIEQSRTLVSALKRLNVPHETYIVTDEGHGMSYLDHEVELYTRIEAFLAKHLATASSP